MTLIPPIRYSLVHDGLSRASWPRPVNYEFLKVKKIERFVAVTNNDPLEEDDALSAFCADNGVELVYVGSSKSEKSKGKNRGVGVSSEQVQKALDAILNGGSSKNTLIFCENGAETTSIIIGCLRKLELWASVSILEEFTSFVGSVSHIERLYLEQFKPELVIQHQPAWLWNGLNDVVINNHPTLSLVSIIH